MGISLKQFGRRLEVRFGEDKLKQAASEVAKNVALAIVKDLASVTPVDTSRAISNWQVEINEPVDDEIPAYFEGIGGSTQDSSEKATIADAKYVLKLKDPGEPIFISNVLPYIDALNNGSSQQEPRGFVERAIAVGREQLRKEKLKV